MALKVIHLFEQLLHGARDTPGLCTPGGGRRRHLRLLVVIGGRLLRRHQQQPLERQDGESFEILEAERVLSPDSQKVTLANDVVLDLPGLSRLNGSFLVKHGEFIPASFINPLE